MHGCHQRGSAARLVKAQERGSPWGVFPAQVHVGAPAYEAEASFRQNEGVADWRVAQGALAAHL